MDKPRFFVGIDIAAASFTSAVGSPGEQAGRSWVRPATFANEFDSFAQYLQWLQEHGIQPGNCVICLEATGVYSEVLVHFLAANGYQVVVEPPLKVKRAFKPAGHKSDPVDSQQIAEYAYRFWDELSLWAPRTELLEQIQTLLTTREQFVVAKTGHQNAWKALQRKAVRTALAESLQEQAIAELKGHIQALEAEIRRLIDQDPDFRQLVGLLLSIPGVGLLLAAHMLVVWQTAAQPPSPKRLAAFIGICPYEDRVAVPCAIPRPRAITVRLLCASCCFWPPCRSLPTTRSFAPISCARSRRANPNSWSSITSPTSSSRVMVAVVRSKTAFIPNYRSVNPGLLKPALTKS